MGNPNIRMVMLSETPLFTGPLIPMNTFVLQVPKVFFLQIYLNNFRDASQLTIQQKGDCNLKILSVFALTFRKHNKLTLNMYKNIIGKQMLGTLCLYNIKSNNCQLFSIQENLSKKSYQNSTSCTLHDTLCRKNPHQS